MENKSHNHGPAIGKKTNHTVMGPQLEKKSQSWTLDGEEHKSHNHGPPLKTNTNHIAVDPQLENKSHTKISTHLYTEMKNVRPKFKMSTNSAACLYIPLYIMGDEWSTILFSV